MFKFFRKTSLYILAIPTLLFGLGFLSNQAVLKANNDTFPVMWNHNKCFQYRLSIVKEASITDKEGNPTREAEQAQAALVAFDEEGFIDDTHVVMSPQTHLNYLGDIFDLRTTYSIGDFMLFAGEYGFGFMLPLFIFDVTRKLREKEECRKY
jgi:hypothetical protein